MLFLSVLSGCSIPIINARHFPGHTHVTKSDSERVTPGASQRLFFGGAADESETLEGKIDEIAVYDRAVGVDEIRRRFHLTVPKEPKAAAELSSAPSVRAVEAALVLKKSPTAKYRKLRMVLLADEKDHGSVGNGLHEYPLWQKRWALLLGGPAASDAKQVNLHGPAIEHHEITKGATNVTVERANGWPSKKQFATADVIVAYCYLAWTDARKKQVAEYLKRGGGLALIHSATWTRPKADPDVAAIVGIGGFTRVRHGNVQVELANTDHVICRNLPQAVFLKDETYWPPTPSVDASRVTVLATSGERVAGENGQRHPQPLFWTFELGRGRAFGCVPGHFAQTFDNPWFRLLLLRGISWAAGETPYRFDELSLRGARVNTEK